MKLEGINDWPKVAQLAAVSSICGNEITVATGVIFLMRKSWNAEHFSTGSPAPSARFTLSWCSFAAGRNKAGDNLRF